ncbi:hydroxymethylbilane synthase [Desulfotomaculum arcticum]|uniref:Porphobilinogen deaminase n=1 Tax=Desulfotruncus arcticus DSM 17038 TaxID=1121424 RepID=A0A1I2NJE1_9FIRM|nr:hydroxymethylbilane synthase [Desulfotruncus arcticus]SFG01817.1 hydroxymethylbilane synthase [Desulfotomaculum arcticum] [Desulfotruncus arcticus DSM 17038]
MLGKILIGSRDSDLAMWQSKWVAEQLRKHNPSLPVVINGMKTKGDNILDVALAKIGDKGLFTKELEHALLAGRISLAVHSMKDLPTELPGGLIIGAICEREYPGDVLIAKNGEKLNDLKAGARIGTSSLRRRAQLLNYRPDFKMLDIRGNLTTRLRKLKELDLDAVVLAYAGIKRMGFEHLISDYIPFNICLPAVGQGAIGVELRANDCATMDVISAIDHKITRIAIEAERSFMKRLEGGCQVPIGALGRVENGHLTLEGIVADLHGTQAVRQSISGPAEKAEHLGEKLAEMLLEQGAGEILTRARQEFGIDDGE